MSNDLTLYGQLALAFERAHLGIIGHKGTTDVIDLKNYISTLFSSLQPADGGTFGDVFSHMGIYNSMGNRIPHEFTYSEFTWLDEKDGKSYPVIQLKIVEGSGGWSLNEFDIDLVFDEENQTLRIDPFSSKCENGFFDPSLSVSQNTANILDGIIKVAGTRDAVVGNNYAPVALAFQYIKDYILTNNTQGPAVPLPPQ